MAYPKWGPSAYPSWSRLPRISAELVHCQQQHDISGRSGNFQGDGGVMDDRRHQALCYDCRSPNCAVNVKYKERCGETSSGSRRRPLYRNAGMVLPRLCGWFLCRQAKSGGSPKYLFTSVFSCQYQRDDSNPVLCTGTFCMSPASSL